MSEPIAVPREVASSHFINVESVPKLPMLLKLLVTSDPKSALLSLSSAWLQ